MGHTTLLDIIGSMVVGGILFIMAFRLNASASESSSAYLANYLLQRNMMGLTVMIEDDLKRVGLNNGNQNGGILTATSNRFRFQTDLQNVGATDVVEYFTGPTSELSSTQNPRDFYLYRRVNDDTVRMNFGLTKFEFQYYNIADPTLALLFPITAFGNIGPIDITIKLESPFAVYKESAIQQDYMNDTTQYEMFWRQIRTVSRNTRLQTAVRPR